MEIAQASEIYQLLSGQRLTREEYKKFEVLQVGTIVRWMTKAEMEQAIKEETRRVKTN